MLKQGYKGSEALYYNEVLGLIKMKILSSPTHLLQVEMGT